MIYKERVVLLFTEVAVIEAPTGGSNDIDVVFATKDVAFKLGTVVSDLTITATLYAPGAALTVGDRVYLPVMDEDLDNANPEQVEIRWPNGTFADLDGKALYLLGNDAAPGAQYTAGKILITLRGFDKTWGF